MSNLKLSDVENIEEGCESEENYYSSIQNAINSCSWSLQGSYGRAMMDAIKGGRCMLGLVGCRDYYGNYIPSRSEVKDGSKGSRSFVVEACGEEWVKLMEGV